MLAVWWCNEKKLGMQSTVNASLKNKLFVLSEKMCYNFDKLLVTENSQRYLIYKPVAQDFILSESVFLVVNSFSVATYWTVFLNLRYFRVRWCEMPTGAR